MPDRKDFTANFLDARNKCLTEFQKEPEKQTHMAKTEIFDLKKAIETCRKAGKPEPDERMFYAILMALTNEARRFIMTKTLVPKKVDGKKDAEKEKYYAEKEKNFKALREWIESACDKAASTLKNESATNSVLLTMLPRGGKCALKGCSSEVQPFAVNVCESCLVDPFLPQNVEEPLHKKRKVGGGDRTHANIPPVRQREDSEEQAPSTPIRHRYESEEQAPSTPVRHSDESEETERAVDTNDDKHVQIKQEGSDDESGDETTDHIL